MLHRAAVRHALLIPVAALAVPVDAAAEVERCAAADVDLSWTATDFVEMSGDTGWFPGSSPAQLRLTGKVAGHTAVDVGMRTAACWRDDMQASLEGRDGSGWLDVAYGAELEMFAKIDTSILGQKIFWQGEIPLPYIPSDLLLAGAGAFDPALDASTSARVTDATQPITLLSTDVIGDLIGITGISGGLRVSAKAVMATSYRSRRAIVAETAVTSPTDQVTFAPPSSGFAGALEVPVALDGVIRYQPTIVFHAGFDVKIFGYRVVDWQLFDVPMTLPALERPVHLTGDAAQVPLPELDGIGEGARIDFATGATQALLVKNRGEGVLELEPTTKPAGVVIERVAVEGGASTSLRVTAADGTFENGPVQLVLATNDPDHPMVTIELGRDVGGTDPGEPLHEEPGESSGCSTGGSLHGGAMLCVLALVLRRRRR